MSIWEFMDDSQSFLNFDRISKLDGTVKRLRQSQLDHSRSRATLADRVDELEADLARALLLLHSLAKVCQDKGLFRAEELDDVMHQLDLADGSADGMITPDAPSGPVDTYEHLRQLEKQSTESPAEFLQELEKEVGDENPESENNNNIG